MKSLIVYSTKTQNTKKLADAIGETLKGDIDIFCVDDMPSAKGYDIIFIGFWLQAGKPDPKTSDYLKTIETNTKIFFFATHGAKPGSDHVKNAIHHAIELVDGARVMGTFTCQGEVNSMVLEKVKQRTEPPVWVSDADDAIGHPNEKDTNALKKLIEAL